MVFLLVGSYFASLYISRFSCLDLAWQTTERASTRLVARGTAKEHAAIGQHPYTVQFFPGFVLPPIGSEYPRPVTQPSDMQSPQPAPAEKSQKRRAPEGQDSLPCPKLKKTKSKAKGPADGSCMSTRYERN